MMAFIGRLDMIHSKQRLAHTTMIAAELLFTNLLLVKIPTLCKFTRPLTSVLQGLIEQTT